MLAIKLACIELPASAPAGKLNMFGDRQLRSQRQNLNLARKAIIEQNLRVSAAGKIAQMDIQIWPPAICGCL